MLNYTIQAKNLGAHLIHVIIQIPQGEQCVVAKMPKWIPGSYKIRDYSRHLQSFCARSQDGELAWHKQDSDTWIIQADGQALTLEYDIYAYDLSVRGAYLDDKRFFFNHCCVCLDIVHLSQEKRLICIDSIDNWPIFTALKKSNNGYIADHYRQQIDCPVESAQCVIDDEFLAQNIVHKIIFTGQWSSENDLEGIKHHLRHICTAQMQLFEGSPLDNYLFMTYLEARQYGGLEHQNSVAQMASPEMIMKKGQPLSDKMIDFFGLCSHEYFHLWNIKRLQAKDFQPYDLYKEQNTEMLWMFEGFTSYYDELFLLRANVINAQTFLKRQAQNLNRVFNTPGRKLQTLAQSSFDAWTKLYQADENSPNHTISYYSKGAAFALYLDLWIRKNSENKSLDDVMRYLWQQFGKQGIGIEEKDVIEACQEIININQYDELKKLFQAALHSTQDLDFVAMFADFGIQMKQQDDENKDKNQSSDCGFRFKMDNNQAKIIFLDAHSMAAKIGISLGDEILAIDQQTAQILDFNQSLNFSQAGEKRHLILARRGRVFEKTIELAESTSQKFSLIQQEENALNVDWLKIWQG